MPPGKEGKIILTVPHTQGYSGEVSKMATVTTNDPSQPAFTLTLRVFFKGGPPAPAPIAAVVHRAGPFSITPSDKWVTATIHGNTIASTLTFSNTQPKPAHITGVEPGGESFKLTLRTVEDGKSYALIASTNPDLKPGTYTQTAQLLSDASGTPKIPITLEVTVYPGVVATPTSIHLSPIAIDGDVSKAVIPAISVRKFRGPLFKIKSVTSTLPFLKFDTQPEVGGFGYSIRSTVEKSGISAPGKYTGKIRIETDDPEAPVIEVSVDGWFT